MPGLVVFCMEHETSEILDRYSFPYWSLEKASQIAPFVFFELMYPCGCAADNAETTFVSLCGGVHIALGFRLQD